MTSLEKGTGFELKIADLFKQKGYHVTHNIKMTGRSGATHQIDVLAQFTAPLHTSSVIIEAKSYQSNIDKDIIMKLVQIQQDLSIDRAILATTSDFTPGALQTAQQYSNVELWDRKKITSLLGEIELLDTGDITKETSLSSVKRVEEKFTLEQIQQYAQEIANKKSKGGLFGKGKIEEKVLGVTKFLYPYYDVDMEAKVRKTEKTGWFSKEDVVTTVESKTGVDANTGAIIHVTDLGISYEYSYLGGLDSDEIYLLYYVSGVKSFEKRSLSAIGWPTTRINKVVNSLAGKGILVQTSTRPAIYKSANVYPNDPSIFLSLSESFPVTEKPTSDKKIDSTLSPASIITAFQNYWSACNVRTIDLIYYPFYGIMYQRDDGTKRFEVIDGVKGTRHEYLERIVSPTIMS